MLDFLKPAGKNIGRELGRTWESLPEGWHKLLSRSSNALTHFSRNSKKATCSRISSWPVCTNSYKNSVRENS